MTKMNDYEQLSFTTDKAIQKREREGCKTPYDENCVCVTRWVLQGDDYCNFCGSRIYRITNYSLNHYSCGAFCTMCSRM